MIINEHDCDATVIYKEQHLRKAYALYTAVVLLSVSVVVLQWRLRGMMFDDAFIHLRIVRNYSTCGRPFFNCHERVMTTSSPLWTIVLTAFGAWQHLWMTCLIESLLLVVCGVLACNLSQDVARAKRCAEAEVERGSNANTLLYHLAVGGCVIMLLLPSSIGQMETPLAIALVLGAMRSILGRRIVALPLLACAASTRLELLPLFFGLFVVGLIGKWPRKPLLFAAMMMFATTAWVYLQFGTFLPNSMHAKVVGYGFSHREVLQQLFAIPVLTRPLTLAFLTFVTSIAILTLCLHPQRRMGYADWLPILSGAWGLVVMSAYVIRKVPIFEWYVPLFSVPLLLCLLLYSQPGSLGVFMNGLVELSRYVSIALLLTVPLWKDCMLFRAGWKTTSLAYAQEDRQDSARVHEYLAVGSVLQTSCPSGSLMTSEIGALGWSFRGHIVDAFGIATPSAMAFQPLISGAETGGIPAAYAHTIRPDVIVSYSSLDTEVRSSGLLNAEYKLIALPTTLLADRVTSFPNGWHKSSHLDVFVLKSGVCMLNDVGDTLIATVQ